MPRRRRERLELNADINVVNLIDVMLLLLVVFMITAPMMTGGVDIRLPRAEARTLETRTGLTVTISQTGQIFVDDDAMSLADFRVAFPAIARRRGQQGIYLRADSRATFGMVAPVLGIMRTANVGNVGIVTEPEEIPR